MMECSENIGTGILDNDDDHHYSIEMRSFDFTKMRI